MTLTVQLCATFYTQDGASLSDSVLTPAQDAVEEALRLGALYFQTYEHIPGPGLNATTRNMSARQYVGIDRVHTRDSLVTLLSTESFENTVQPSDPLAAKFSARMAASAHIAKINGLRKADEDSRWIVTAHGKAVLLRDDEIVFNAAGRKIWPHDKAPAPQAPHPAHSKPFA